MSGMWIKLLPLLLVGMGHWPQAQAATVVATVNGEPIYKAEIQNTSKAKKFDSKKSLEHLILYRLALQEAKKQNVASRPGAKKEIEKILYKHYLKETLLKEKANLQVSQSELKRYYRTHPYLRLSHLVLLYKNKTEKKESKRKLQIIQRKLSNGTKFKTLVLKYSQDASAKMAGDLDYQGAHSLPTPYYTLVTALKPNEVSKPLYRDGAIHLFKLEDRKSLSQIPASYRQFLRSEIRKEKEFKFLKAQLGSLKKRAKIRIHRERKP